MGIMKRLTVLLMLILMALFIVSAPARAAGETYVIPIHGTIDNGNWLFIQRAYKEALANNAAAIIFDIDTYGGFVDSAISIADLILASQVPTYTYVNSKGISAGSLIALAGQTLVMTPGATMGAAEPRLLGQVADEKELSMWVSKLVSVAETNGRNGQIAAAMADVNIEIEGLSEQGKLLTLTAAQAVEYEIADGICRNRAELIEKYGLPGTVVELEQGFQERMGGLLSNPWISIILLALGIAGIVIEVMSAGSFGVFGAVGLISFALYFIGNFWAGNIGVGAILLFLVGLVLIIMEIFLIPGFGITGVLGIAAIFASLVMASANFSTAILTLAGALLLAIIIIAVTLKNRQTRKVWGKLILSHKQETDKGYASLDLGLAAYMGKRGKAITTLRPAGTADIEGKRLDVVTSGEFIEAGSDIEVILVEGMRVVVRESN